MEKCVDTTDMGFAVDKYLNLQTIAYGKWQTLLHLIISLLYYIFFAFWHGFKIGK